MVGAKQIVGVLLGCAALAPQAHAADTGPYMWGVGVKLGTSFIPGRYPYAFPTAIEKYNFIEEGANAGPTDGDNKDRDENDNGDLLFSTLQPVGFDFRLGGEGFYGIDQQNRIGAGFGFGFGSRYSDGWFTLNYDRVLVSEGEFNVLLGGQIGYGSVGFRGNPEEGGESERLRMSYYPLRARLAGQFLNDTQAYGLGLFLQFAVPAQTTYLDLDGVEQPKVGSFGNVALFPMLGIEIDVQFGDFTPPKKKGGKKGGGKGGGGAGKGGGGKGGKGK